MGNYYYDSLSIANEIHTLSSKTRSIWRSGDRSFAIELRLAIFPSCDRSHDLVFVADREQAAKLVLGDCTCFPAAWHFNTCHPNLHPTLRGRERQRSLDNNVLIRSGDAPAISWSRNMLYSGFNNLPRSVVRRQTRFAARITRTLYSFDPAFCCIGYRL